MVKSDPTLRMNVHQYLVTGRRVPTEKTPTGEIISIRVFAPNEIVARSKFWFQTRRLNKLKRAQGEILSVSEIFEKNQRTVKTYGINFRYQSRTAIHNMYKEIRDVSLNGAISQLYIDMSGKHRARHDTLHILRTCVVTKGNDVRRPQAAVYRDSGIKFPIVKTIPRSSERRFRSVFKANRPTTIRK